MIDAKHTVRSIHSFRVLACVLGSAFLLPACSFSQTTASEDFTSIGRGAPSLNPATRQEFKPTGGGGTLPMMADLANVLNGEHVVGPLLFAQGDLFGMVRQDIEVYPAANGDVPEGITALDIDLFSSKDFYQDKEHWTDPRYFRCNSSFGIEQQRVATPLSSATIGDNPPYTAAWGYCDRDYPREAIISPYEFTTAQAHYQALLGEAEQRGGPTQHDYGSVPGQISGVYSPNFQMLFESWYGMVYSQASTIVSLLTEEYQTRFVQQSYHQSTTGASQWTAMYCQPEGFMRRWHWAATTENSVIVTPDLVQVLASQADNFITNIYVGKQFDMEGIVPKLGPDVPRWYGESVGFWDGDTLITWTSNIQGWMSHSAFEFSNKMQTIEIYTPVYDEQGIYRGLTHEAVFYDPEALVEPVRIVRYLAKMSDFKDAQPFTFIECVQSIYPIDGRATPVPPGSTIEYKVPDIYGRPWAQIWDEHFEQDMQKPEEEDLFSF